MNSDPMRLPPQNLEAEAGVLGSVLQDDDAFDEALVTPFYIDDSPSLTVPDVAAIARRYRRKHGIGLVIVDYLQLLAPTDGHDGRQEQVSKMSRGLKNLARELKVPVVALSQLSRAVEKREKQRPMMADLRESGAIEQDADLVLLHRPDYYDPNDKPGLAEVIVAKNRHGATKAVELTFNKPLFRFERLAGPVDEAAF